MMNKILIVDDDRNVLEQLGQLLKADGHEIAFIPRSEFIFKRLETDSYDLILLDVNMPGQNGMETLELLKKSSDYSDIPVIMITGEGDDHTLRQCFELGAIDYIEKPIREIALIARVNAALRAKKLQNQLIQNQVKLKNQEIKIEQQNARQTQLKFLAAQMNPHFIFNSLNSIQFFVLENEKEKALEVLSEFSRLMREAMMNSGNRFITIAQEISFLEKYLKLEQMRFPNKLDYKIELDEEIDEDEFFIPPMLLQPYIENAIVHGISHKDGAGKIIISFQLNDEYINCVIEDDGVGREAAMELNKKRHGNKHVSMAMKINEMRIGLLNESEPEQNNFYYEIEDLKSDKGTALGTKVTLKIPEDTGV